VGKLTIAGTLLRLRRFGGLLSGSGDICCQNVFSLLMIFPQTVVTLYLLSILINLFTVQSFLALILHLHASQRCRDTLLDKIRSRTKQVFIDVFSGNIRLELLLK